jgi:flagellar hook-associated protein 2
MASPSLQLSGLASGFDWKTFTDSVISYERAPATRYQAEQAQNDDKKSQLSQLGSNFTSLQTAMTALSASSLGSGRKVVNDSSSAVIKASVSSSTPIGSYEIQVTHLATASRLTGRELSSRPTVLDSDTLTLQGTATGTPTTIPITAGMTVSDIVAAINASGAGITAIANKAGTKMVLTNQLTGAGNDLQVGGSLKSTLGLDAAPPTPATDTSFTINGIPFTSADNTLDSTDHGIVGLSLKIDATTLSKDDPAMASSETLSVSADASDMRRKIDAFVSSYNAVADFIDGATAYTTTAGKTTAGPLADNREIQQWLKELRSTAFHAPQSGAIKNLSALGLDFSSKDSRIVVTDSAKLDTALADHAADVGKFFNNTDAASPGLATAFVTKITSYVGSDGTAGQLKTKLESYTKANTSLDDQIAALDRYLAQRRSQLEAGFMAMESAQSQLKNMQTQLTNSFGQKSA